MTRSISAGYLRGERTYSVKYEKDSGNPTGTWLIPSEWKKEAIALNKTTKEVSTRREDTRLVLECECE